MKIRRKSDEAVSEIVGEMLMLVLVLVLLAVFSSSLSSYLPAPRDPTVTIQMSPLHDTNLTLYHKGGDAILREDIEVIVGDRKVYGGDLTINSTTGQGSYLFDLGDSITISSVKNGDEITLATPRAILYKGVAREA